MLWTHSLLYSHTQTCCVCVLYRSTRCRAVDSGMQRHAPLHTPLVSLLIGQHLAVNMAHVAALPHSPRCV